MQIFLYQFRTLMINIKIGSADVPFVTGNVETINTFWKKECMEKLKYTYFLNKPSLFYALT